jgi:hypothetical protein
MQQNYFDCTNGLQRDAAVWTGEEEEAVEPKEASAEAVAGSTAVDPIEHCQSVYERNTCAVFSRR